MVLIKNTYHSMNIDMFSLTESLVETDKLQRKHLVTKHLHFR